MKKLSAGLLPFRRRGDGVELFLVHPGGPFWARKDAGAWSIAKGEFDSGEEPLRAAIREFREETGFEPSGPFIALGEARQPSGKTVFAWAFEGDFDPAKLESNSFAMEWPSKSGRLREFPEMDRAAWLAPDVALKKILPGQAAFIERLLSGGGERRERDP